jgi:PmbA protein
MDSSEVAAEMIRQLDLARNNAPIKSGTMPVIFTPFGVAGSLLAPLISAFNGKTVLDGASPLKDKKGMAIFDSRLLLIDDPTIPYQPGSTPFDDEERLQGAMLIDHGKSRSLLWLRATPADRRATGNAQPRQRYALSRPCARDRRQEYTPDMIRDMKVNH